jgi:hypothetical protein
MTGTINGVIVRETQRPRPDSGNGPAAGRLYNVLVEHFCAEQVFKDVDNIERRSSSDVLLALIGPQWPTPSTPGG